MDKRSLDNLIHGAEEKWMSLLWTYCSKLFSGTTLPSHDQFHHYRVWHYLKQVMTGLTGAGISLSERIPEKAIIAAFFHDTGLVHTMDESHGSAGRAMCLDFFRASGLPYPQGIDEILFAIEQHDDKAYRAHEDDNSGNGQVPGGSSSGITGLLALLSTGDDMDALGYIGIYRYAEIYLLRGVSEPDLPSEVLPNLENRFHNLLHRYGNLTSFISVQKQRYALIRDFYSSPDNLKILRFLHKNAEKGSNLLDMSIIDSMQNNEGIILDFIRLLHEENSVFPYP